MGNIGSDSSGFAKFEGKDKHANAFAYWFRNNDRYSGLISYLQACQKGYTTPDRNICINYIANAGYGGDDHEAYAALARLWLSTLLRHSNVVA